MDPLVQWIELLRPRTTLWSRIEAHGSWALGFHARQDMLFCSIVQGSCLLIREGEVPIPLGEGDFWLVKTSKPFRLASSEQADVTDSEVAYAAARQEPLRLGNGDGAQVVLRGGKFMFDSGNEQMLTSLLPPVIHVAADAGSAGRVHQLLRMNAEESEGDSPGAGFVVARLMELLLVELLRTRSSGRSKTASGLLAGLADPVVEPALKAMHSKIAYRWTLAELARVAGVSRSGLAERFARVMGRGPIEYLIDWKMAVAKDELRRGVKSLGEIAFAIGFQSESAFSTAFRREVGVPPSRYATSIALAIRTPTTERHRAHP